ncbi:hypothetical protein HHK36_031114 [Tetracentron sinense]|uniref:Retroviral polymerase SH3-like domain-containing protein n=1 Tax=Tetracentron sinense TaxID=13715 RepID=A0A834YE82_TETSI|nr:hypothetical protein HHK36_031114 [Tetracentron sinense]
MTASRAIHKTPSHVCSISLPSRSHPLTASVEEQLYRLRTSEATSPSSIRNNLGVLNDLYERVNGVLQLPLTLQAFSHERNEKWVDEMLDGSLMLLDLCGTTRDVFSQMKECVQDLESSLRRRKGGEFSLANIVGAYLISRKKVNKVIRKCFGDLKRVEKHTFSAPVDRDRDLVAMVSMLREVEAITLSVFESLLSFVYGPKARSKQSGWSLVSKLMQTKRVSCEVEQANINGVHKVDVAVYGLNNSQILCKEIDVVQVQNVQKRLEALEWNIQDLEEGLESVCAAGFGSRAITARQRCPLCLWKPGARRCPTKNVKNKTPQEAWSGYKPSVSHLKIFGCIAYAQVPEAKKKKLDDRGEKCIFIGYSEESKAYKLYNPLTNKVVVSRDVIFSEEETWNWDKEEKIKENRIEIEEQETDHGEQNQENMRQTISTPAPCASSSIVRRSPDARLITPEGTSLTQSSTSP